jgi:hypothetical protein
MAQCEDSAVTVANFAASIPQFSKTELRRGRFSTREIGQHSSRFEVSYILSGKSVWQKVILDRDDLGGGLTRLLPLKESGFSALAFVYMFGAAGRIGCVIIVSPSLQSTEKAIWTVGEPNYDRDRWLVRHRVRHR